MSDFFDSTFSGASFKRVLLSFFIIFIHFFVCAEVLTDDSSDKKTDAALKAVSAPTVYTKEEFVAKFIEKTGSGDLSQYELEKAEADYDYVIAQMFPRIKLVTGFGPHPKYIYENSGLVDSDEDGIPDGIKERKWRKYYSKPSDWGIAVRLKGEIVLPIYTFGKIYAAKHAAQAQIDVRKAEAKIADLKVRKEALTFYWSWVMAQNYFEILEPAMKELDKAEEKLRDMLYEEKEGVTQKDLNKLLIEKEKIQYLYERLQLQTDTLKSLISEILGENWAFADKEIVKQDFSKEMPELVDFMKQNSPYSVYVQKGLYAYEKLYRLEVRRLFPDFGMIGSYSYKYTSSVEDKNYPEANSPYNGLDGEIGIGFIFDLNIMEQISKIKKAKAEWNYMKAKAFLAEKTVSLQIQRKYNDLKSLDSHITHLKKIRKTTKGMMTTEYANYESGMKTDTKDLIDAVKSFFENEQEYIQAIYDYNMKVEDIIEFTGAVEK